MTINATDGARDVLRRFDVEEVDTTYAIGASAAGAGKGVEKVIVRGKFPRGLPIVAFECRDKANDGNPDEMRQTLMRMFDLTYVTLPYPG